MKKLVLLFILLLPYLILTAQESDLIYFVSGETIYLLDLNTASSEILAKFDGDYDGEIACSQWLANNEALIITTGYSDYSIYRLIPESRELATLVRLRDLPEADDWYPTCPPASPDGNLLAFRSDQGGFSSSIYTMNSDGSNIHSIVPQVSYLGQRLRFPGWSHDSRWLIFSGMIGEDLGYFRVAPDGSQLTFISTIDEIDEMTYFLGVSSPDDLWSTYIQENAREIWLENLLNGAKNRLFSYDGIYLFHPVWSADSQFVLFISASGSFSDPALTLDRIRPNGEVTRVFEIPYHIGAFTGIFAVEPPIYSPDMNWLVFEQTYDLISLSTGEVIHLPYIEQITPFLWSEDSQTVWYLGGNETDLKLYGYDIASGESREIMSVGQWADNQAFGHWPD